MASEYQRFVGNYMKGRARSGPGAFAANRALMSQAAAAWRAQSGGRRRRNPDDGDRSGGRRVRSNPAGGFSGAQLALIGVGLYALVPAVRAQVNMIARQLGQAGTVATQPTQGA